MNFIAKFFEHGLWHSRLIVLVAIFASVLVAFGVIVMVTVDASYLLGKIIGYMAPTLDEKARTALRLDVIGDIVGVVDGYLLAAILILFALGLYELFIGNLAAVEQSPVAARLLQVKSIDDLKDKLGRVVLLILVVKFFQQALQLKYTTPLDLVYLAAGTALLGVALYLTSGGKKARAATSLSDSE